MTLRRVIAFCLISFPLPTIAQNQPADGSLSGRITYCARDLADIGRLECFDTIAKDLAALGPQAAASSPQTPAAAAPAPVTAMAPSPPAAASEAPTSEGPIIVRNEAGKIDIYGNWIVLRNVDPLTDKPRITLVNTDADDGASHDRPALHLRCRDSQLEAFVLLRGYIGSGAARSVRYRVDRADPVTQSWSPSTNGRSVFSPNPGAFATSLVDASTFIIEATGFDGSRSRATFDVTGLKEIISELDVCRRPARPAAPAQRRRS